MSNQNFNTGQEITSEDLNSLSSRLERGMNDRIIYEMLNKKTDAFFQGSFQVLFQSSSAVTVKAGLGFQSRDTGTLAPIKKPLVNLIDVTQVLNSPDSSDDRIDIICVQAALVNDESSSRKFKDEFTSLITTQNFVVSKDWLASLNYVAGTPSGSPAVPATPAGYLKIAEILVSASTGVSSQAAITDKRSLLPFCVATSATGSSEYDAIVGDPLVAGVTYSDLKSALDNASDGWKILVLRNETINTIPIVTKNKVEIVFKRGVTFTKGSATSGLQVNGNDCKVSNARFSGFNTGGDKALKINAGALRSYLDAPRFLTCATNIDDQGTETYVNVEFTE